MVRQELPLERVPHAHIRRTVPQPGEVEPDVLAPHHGLEGLPNLWLVEQPKDVSIMAAREPFIGPDCQPFVAPGDYGADVAEQGTERARLPKIPHEIGAARELKDFIAAVSR